MSFKALYKQLACYTRANMSNPIKQKKVIVKISFQYRFKQSIHWKKNPLTIGHRYY